MALNKGLALIAYGLEGIGKTSFALEFPKPLRVLSIRESGYTNLEDIGEVPPESENDDVEDFDELIREIRKSKDFRTVVIDSTSGMNQVTRTKIIADVYDNDEGKYSAFSQGPKQQLPIWIGKIETELSALRAKGVNVILIGHDKREIVKNFSGVDYQADLLDMDEAARDVLTKWAQAVLFMALDLEVVTTRTYKGKAIEGKVKDDLESVSDRIMYCQKHPSHSAKNCLKLPPYIMLGNSPQESYQRFLEKLPEPIQDHLA